MYSRCRAEFTIDVNVTTTGGHRNSGQGQPKWQYACFAVPIGGSTLNMPEEKPQGPPMHHEIGGCLTANESSKR